MNSSDFKPELRINLHVLEELGIKLYSNVPAVLSEIVANSWDADASEVKIRWKNGNTSGNEIVIEDNGIGMNGRELQDRFLTVGFPRREKTPGSTEKGRAPMGRKGIGKLCTFSIADIVRVETAKDGEKHAIEMRLQDIRGSIRNEEDSYNPKVLPPDDIKFPNGTRITLSSLRRRQTKMTPNHLRRRIARRFSIIDDEDFKVEINGQCVEPADRGYYDKLQFLWTYGDQKEVMQKCTNLKENFDRTCELGSPDSEIEIKGWIGTVENPSQLKDEDDGKDLNRIAIFVRGKLAQENVLGDFGRKEVFTSYIVGEIHCEALDDDDQEDIATSNRQQINEDSYRFKKLKETIGGELSLIASGWNGLRLKEGAEKARKIPEIKDWIDQLPEPVKKKAERWVGRLNTIGIQEDRIRKELLKSSVLGFETYRRKENLEKLESISDANLPEVLPFFEEIDDLEISYYGQIVKGRVKEINVLRNITEEDATEKVIQEYLFDHLWLLDPSWERAKGTERLETSVANFLKENTAELTEEERRARVDIGYRTLSGRHVIIELKRYSFRPNVHDLAKQIDKYLQGAEKIISKSGQDWPVEIICVLGNSPSGDPYKIQKTLEAVRAKVVLYDQLLDNAYAAYQNYFEKYKKIDKLGKLLESIDNFSEIE